MKYVDFRLSPEHSVSFLDQRLVIELTPPPSSYLEVWNAVSCYGGENCQAHHDYVADLVEPCIKESNISGTNQDKLIEKTFIIG